MSKNQKNQNAPQAISTLDVTNAVSFEEMKAALDAQFAEMEKLFGRDRAATAVPRNIAEASVSVHSAQDKLRIEVLKARNVEIDAEIEALVGSLRIEKAANLTELASLNASPSKEKKATGSTHTRVDVPNTCCTRTKTNEDGTVVEVPRFRGHADTCTSDAAKAFFAAKAAKAAATPAV